MHNADRVATERRSGRTPGVENGRKDSAIWAAGTHQLIWPTDHQESGGQLSSTVINPLTHTIGLWTTRRWTGS